MCDNLKTGEKLEGTREPFKDGDETDDYTAARRTSREG